MTDAAPILLWFRRDFRLSDHEALTAACKTGRPVIPLFIHDGLVEKLAAAPKWRLGLGLGALDESLRDKGSRLILRRRGSALDALKQLIGDTGATALYYSSLYDPETVARDTSVYEALTQEGIEVADFAGHLLYAPDSVETQAGGFYKVYTPYWNAVKTRDIAEPLRTPNSLNPPERWPDSEALQSWNMGAQMNRGADVVRPFVRLGEQAAQSRLSCFVAEIVDDYKQTRDIPGVDGTSNLSENLSLGEITPRQCWHAGQRALEEGKRGAETFLKELVWREFAYHLVHHTPRLLDTNWREEWDAFPWKNDARAAEVWAWKKGRTGIPFVDAAMRELYVTGRMHNRGRMIVASYLTKHLLTDWRIGQQWFEECLIDWDPANNAMGWQWAAGSGPDASPYFRIFNPETQLDKFDKQRDYTSRWIAEGRADPHEDALAFFDAIPRHWHLSPDDAYPDPIMPLDEGRKRALAAYENRKD